VLHGVRALAEVVHPGDRRRCRHRGRMLPVASGLLAGVGGVHGNDAYKPWASRRYGALLAPFVFILGRFLLPEPIERHSPWR
jgi:hypothetical protein